jgi:RNA-directed DNA polymerase
MPTSIWSLFARESTESSEEEKQMTMDPQRSIGASSDGQKEWDSQPWDSFLAQVRRLQMRIAKAIREAKPGTAKALQWLLTHSHAAKMLAVKRVTENKGARTPGVDNEVWKTGRQKLAATTRLRRRGHKPSPLRRIYIKKKNGKLRPLSIPTLLDRAHQALHMMALQPVAESRADWNSYGFREGRSCADAIGQCFITLAKKASPEWILEGDIKSCFDEISHTWLLEHIPMDRRILGQWLQAGFLEEGRLFPTTAGTPQGGIASPLLANLTLDGLEASIRGAIQPRRDKVNFIRYADDFIVTAARPEILHEQVKPVIIRFLAERGLRLSEEKTLVTHIQKGFNFLGQTVRKHGAKLLITPTRQSVRHVLEKARQLIRSCHGHNAATLIRRLNPILRGWANYHRNVVSKRIYGRVDHLVKQMLWQWAHRQHPKKSRGWIQQRYFSADEPGRFSTRTQDQEGKTRWKKVYAVARTVIQRHIKVRGPAHPYHPDYVDYFKKRRCFAWRTYPLGKACQIAPSRYHLRMKTHKKPDGRITSAEANLRKARAV